MTTHNIEYLDNFLQAVEETDADILENDVRVITLRQVNDSVVCLTLTGKKALQAREDGLDVRL